MLGLSLERLEDVRIHSTLPLLNEVDSCNRTPLFWAAKTGNTDAVRHLLAYGASRFLPDFSGASPLHVPQDMEILIVCDCLSRMVLIWNAVTGLVRRRCIAHVQKGISWLAMLWLS